MNTRDGRFTVLGKLLIGLGHSVAGAIIAIFVTVGDQVWLIVIGDWQRGLMNQIGSTARYTRVSFTLDKLNPAPQRGFLLRAGPFVVKLHRFY